MRNTNIQKTRSRKKLWLVVGIFSAVAIGTYVLLAQQNYVWPFTQNKAGVDRNNMPSVTTNPSPKNNNTLTKSNDIKSSDATAQTTDQVPVTSSMSAQLGNLSEADNTVTFSMNVQNATDGGTCVVTFTNPNDRPVTKQFSPMAKENVILCQTSVSAYEFSFLGQWHTVGRYYVNDKQVTVEGDITIK